MTIDRHDFTKADRDIMNAAVALDIVDAVALGVLLANHGTKIDSILADLMECAWAHRHGSDAHVKFGRLLDDRIVELAS